MRFRPTPLGEIARHVGALLEGDAALVIERPGTLEAAGPGELTFLANAKYAPLLPKTRASAVIVDGAAAGAPHGVALLRVERPYLAFARAVALLCLPERPAPGVQPGAHVHPAARVDAAAAVLPGAYVGAEAMIGAGSVLYPGAVVMERCLVGRDCLLYPGAVLREDCVLGDRVILHNHVSIGADGFGFAQQYSARQVGDRLGSTESVRHVKIPQVGNVVVGDDVEIGAGCCVDRAAMGSTTIGRGTKMDDLVMVGHGCQIGEDCLIVAQSGMAGSARIEDRVTLGARAGVLGHLTVGAGSVLYSRTHVTKSLPEGSIVSGNPARPHREQLRQDARLAGLERLAARVSKLEERAAPPARKAPRTQRARTKPIRKKPARSVSKRGQR